ncbi:MAG TPA: endonuclease/exonuclease/phosphatase family protein [Terriglobales bacterium]|nr:endonuclease/exonuclease/phosphatase family protein [Terriglobales bacterium]
MLKDERTAVRLRVATYNVHKCKGLDQRTRPERIARVLRELKADVIALQEVLSFPRSDPPEDQAAYLAQALEPEYHYRLGENRKHRGAAYGNVVLSRFPIVHMHNYDITRSGRERRGCMRVDLDLGGRLLHVFNVHLGTGFFERRYQGDVLVGREILINPELRAPRIVLGDFNEWTRGLATRLLRQHFAEVDVKNGQPRRRTFPGVLPLLHLDHIYYERGLRLLDFRIHRSRLALVASDHVPLVAEFDLGPAAS